MSKMYRDKNGKLQEDRRLDERRHDYCDMVMENKQRLGEISVHFEYMRDDIAEIRKAVSNGLSDKLHTCEERLTKFEKNTWLISILNSGTKKFLVALVVILLMAATNASVWMLFKTSVYKETPGQLLRLSQAVMSNGYMLHTTTQGYKIMTANDANKKAWIYDEKKNEWLPAPQHRVIEK